MAGWCFVSANSRADEPAPIDESQLRSAVERGLTILQKAARNYPQHRRCFSCHHQTLPLLAMREARQKKLATDETLFDDQVKFTANFFTNRRERLLEGKAVEGAGLTVGYGLWTLEIAAAPTDENTQAMVHNLIQRQREDGSWRIEAVRPPMEESLLTCTVLAAYGVKRFAIADQSAAAKSTVEKAVTWMRKAEIKTQEDRAFRLWGEKLLGDPPQNLEPLRKAVLETQREDGGWSQIESLGSDAYATGQSLFVLRESGEPTDSSAWRRGILFLLKTQQADGSWHVRTRAKPVQTYFDNGDPHGKDQFLSIAATGWATASLAAELKIK